MDRHYNTRDDTSSVDDDTTSSGRVLQKMDEDSMIDDWEKIGTGGNMLAPEVHQQGGEDHPSTFTLKNQ
jgi:hypothetical protein